MSDINISGGNGMFLFELNSVEAREWVESNVATEGWQWFGTAAFGVGDTRLAQDIAAGAQADGLVVE